MSFVFSFESYWLHDKTYTDHDETVCEMFKTSKLIRYFFMSLLKQEK